MTTSAFHSVTRSNKARATRGFMSIELGLVLMVVAIAIAAAVLWYRDTLRKESVKNNGAELISTASNLVAKYGQLNRYGDVTSEIAVQAGIVPAHLRDPGANTAANRFGGVIALTPQTLTAPNDSVQIDWPNTPSNQCSDIITQAQGEFRVISVSGTEVKADGADLDLAALEAACGSGGAPVDLSLTVGRN